MRACVMRVCCWVEVCCWVVLCCAACCEPVCVVSLCVVMCKNLVILIIPPQLDIKLHWRKRRKRHRPVSLQRQPMSSTWVKPLSPVFVVFVCVCVCFLY